jgi:hypothetical protein
MNFTIQHQARQWLRRMALTLALAASCLPASAGLIRVSIDTSTFGVASGYIDMEFSTFAGGPLSMATVSNMLGFSPAPAIQWGVEGAAGNFLFRSDTVNLLSHAASFGSVLSFDLAIEGEADPTGTFVSAFKVAAFDGINYLGQFDPATGALATFLWTPTANAGGALAFDVADASVTVVPEPADALLMVIGLAVMMLALRRRAHHIFEIKKD